MLLSLKRGLSLPPSEHENYLIHKATVVVLGHPVQEFDDQSVVLRPTTDFSFAIKSADVQTLSPGVIDQRLHEVLCKLQ